MIEVLVANRLTSPTPLRRVEDWAATWAVEEMFGIAAAALNDDRIGRALDAIAPNLEQIVGSVGARAIASFGLEVARLHWDMTSISLCGAYDQVEDGFVAPGSAIPRPPPRPQAGADRAGVSGDGGVPVWHRADDGGAGEVAQVAGAMRALRQLAGQRRLLLVGDSKLVSSPRPARHHGRRGRLHRAGVQDLGGCRGAGSLDPAAATPVDYVAERDHRKPPDQRGSYRVVEDTMTLAGKRQRDPVLHCAGCCVVQRPRRRGGHRPGQEARPDPGRPSAAHPGPGQPPHPDAQAVTARLAASSRSRRVTDLLCAQVGTDQATGKPTLTWWFDPDALAAEAATDGWYGLLTNLDPTNADTAQVLARYKGQEVVERRYGTFKGPLAVAPLFVHSNRRIQTLVTVICPALLIFCLVERQVRRAAPTSPSRGCTSASQPSPPGGSSSKPWPVCG